MPSGWWRLILLHLSRRWPVQRRLAGACSLLQADEDLRLKVIGYPGRMRSESETLRSRPRTRGGLRRSVGAPKSLIEIAMISVLDWFTKRSTALENCKEKLHELQPVQADGRVTHCRGKPQDRTESNRFEASCPAGEWRGLRRSLPQAGFFWIASESTDLLASG